MNQLRCRSCGHLFSGPVVDRAVGEGWEREFLCERCQEVSPRFEFDETLSGGMTLNRNDYSDLIAELYQSMLIPPEVLKNSCPRFSIEHTLPKVVPWCGVVFVG